MSLKEYAKKRDFSKTPEPPRRSRGKAEGLRFVVHKHHARNLHYDLRLEHKGVLKSWAIPKGISANPADKRLAIMVEDHPFEYKDFEGLIPEGNYGAGSVIIWDEGTYFLVGGEETGQDKKMTQQLAKGHLSIVFKGKKLRGEFYMLRLSKNEKQWLIIKKADAAASQAGKLR